MSTNPPELDAAIAKHRQGQMDEAASVYRAFSEKQPELAEPWHLLGVVELQRGQPKNAVPLFREALKRDPDHFMCLSNLGGALYQLKNYTEAETALRAAVRLSPDYINAVYNLGNTLLATGGLDEAVEHFQKALSLKPSYPEAQNNLAETLKQLGRLDEAVTVLQSALAQVPEDTPGHALLSESLIELLNGHMPPADARGPLARLQEALETVRIENADAAPLADETVRLLYKDCSEVLSELGLTGAITPTQMWRGKTDDPGCKRHMTVFKKHNAIAETCFACFKIQIEPRTVVELFKLLVVFEGLALPNDSTRKCLVEVRPNITGAYKGLIYCQSFEEGQAVLQSVRAAVADHISDQISVVLKRGCSEFPVAYPEYGRITDDGAGMMDYPEEWRRFEQDVDQNDTVFSSPLVFGSHNHRGYTLRDVLVMRTWLAYAAAIGDDSYQTISSDPVAPMALEGRAAFQPPDDETKRC